MSASKKSLIDSARKFLDGIADDLAMIGTQEHADEIFVEYSKALNASQAITTVANRHARIEEERRRREEAEAAQKAMQTAQERVDEALQAETPPEALTPPETVEPAPAPAEAPQEAAKVYSMTFTVRGTLDQLRAVKRFLVDGGYDYE